MTAIIIAQTRPSGGETTTSANCYGIIIGSSSSPPPRIWLMNRLKPNSPTEPGDSWRCVLPYYAVRDIRHGVRCPGNDVNRFMCVPGQILLSRFSISPLFEQPGQKHPRKIANSALPHNIRHHTSAEFRASGFAYIERSRDGLSRFPKRGQNHEPGQRNLARFARQSVAVTTGTPTAHR